MGLVSKGAAANSVRVELRAKAFANDLVRSHVFEVDRSGVIRVWSPESGEFTTQHVLSEDAKRRIRLKVRLLHGG